MKVLCHMRKREANLSDLRKNIHIYEVELSIDRTPQDLLGWVSEKKMKKIEGKK